jgi:glucosylceramidase
MKSNKLYGGGTLKPKFYQAYADYFVKYLQTMKDNGINISAISTQNEPECGTNKPSMKMDASSQAKFIGKYLGPTLEKNGFGDIEIFCWDHNCDKKDFALSVLGDSDANKYVSGSAWHLYAGDIKILSEVYDEQPEKKLWLTEQWTGRNGEFAGDFKWHLKNVILGTVNNHGQAAFEWNLAADQNCDPHTVGGCPDCKGAITINKKSNKVDSYNVSYYIIGQAAKFVRPGSVKISSKSSDDSLINAAFETKEGKIVLIVLNDGNKEVDFKVKFEDNTITSKLNAGAAATYVW